MDRSRRGTKDGTATPVPAASRLTVRGKKNRRRPGSVWSRLPRPRAIADACGRAVRRSLPALAATAGITVVGVGAWAGYRFITTSERFAITSIEVTGETHLSADQIRAALPVKLGDNVFATNLGKLSEALRATPWIASASVHRVLPHTLVVEVTEHAPVAMVELGELYLVDATGHPFKRAQLETGDGANLPVITGIDRATYESAPQPTAATITAALAALATWRQEPSRPAIGELHLDAHRALTLRTYERATAIQLGPIGPELAARMQTFDTAWAELSEPERLRARAIHVDARIDQVTVALNTLPKD
jgi:cell division septal protein FtsQ